MLSQKGTEIREMTSYVVRNAGIKLRALYEIFGDSAGDFNN